MTAGKAIVLTIWIFVSKMMSLLCNTLPSFIIAFLLKSKRLLILWLHSPSTVVLEPKKIKLSLFPLFPLLFDMKWWDQMLWSWFFTLPLLMQTSPGEFSPGKTADTAGSCEVQERTPVSPSVRPRKTPKPPGPEVSAPQVLNSALF